MPSTHKKPTILDNNLWSDWGYFAAAGIFLLLADFFLLPLLLTTSAAHPLTLPIIQTICQYSTLFLGILALIKAINRSSLKTINAQRKVSANTLKLTL